MKGDTWKPGQVRFVGRSWTVISLDNGMELCSSMLGKDEPTDLVGDGHG